MDWRQRKICGEYVPACGIPLTRHSYRRSALPHYEGRIKVGDS